MRRLMMSYELPITGGCLCGQVRYRITAKPIGSGNCHCRTCQKSSGSAYLPVLFVLSNALEIEGLYKEFPSVAASGNTVYRGFCPNCGAALFGRNIGHPELRPVSAASLDDPSVYEPHVDFWVCDAQPWDYMNPELEKFQQNAEHF